MKELANFAEKNLIEKPDEPFNGEWKVDKAVVMVIRAKTRKLDNILQGYETNTEVKTEAVTEKLTKEGKKVRLSVTYLKEILRLLTKMDSDYIELRVDNDYPIWLKNDEVEIILAPRVSDD